MLGDVGVESRPGARPVRYATAVAAANHVQYSIFISIY